MKPTLPPSEAFIRDVRTMPLPGVPQARLLRCRFDSSRYDDDWFARYGVPFPPALASAAVRRKAEHLAGRYLCKELLGAAGLPPLVPIGKSRAPVWPDGWLGSITHVDGIAMCCLCRKADVALLGIDLEYWMEEGVAHDIAPTIVDARERELLAAPWSFSRGLSLVFSAKESFFKAAFPHVGRYFDFHAVRIVRIDHAARRFDLQVVEPLAPGLLPGHIVTGSFLDDEETVFTSIAERAG
jgi:enterobactin synthetase component D